ncbi:MAG: histidine phosphatase family protein [Chloroflexota bacterium]|nr:histidine phosphatase family protein [Chloroflexota bacterium]
MPMSSHPAQHPHLRHPRASETTLYLVRHGRTDSNVRGILHGSTDVPLDAQGLRQARCVAERIAADVTVDALLSSPLARALTTARMIGARIGIEPIAVPELVEMDFGALEGLTVDRIEAEHPEIARRMRDFTDDDLAWPGGESRRGFHLRVLAAFEAILADHASRTVVVVAHGGVIGSYLAQIHGISPNDWEAYPLGNCSLTHLHVTADHTMVHRINDQTHLDLLYELDRPEAAPWQH